VGLGARGERGDLFVAHGEPFDGLARPKRFGDAVEGIADEAVDALDASDLQGLDELFCDVGHAGPPWVDTERCIARGKRRVTMGW
jgi:hypothetical protein